MNTNPVYTVRDFRLKLKEALDLAHTEYHNDNDEFFIEIHRGKELYYLYCVSSGNPLAGPIQATEPVAEPKVVEDTAVIGPSMEDLFGSKKGVAPAPEWLEKNKIALEDIPDLRPRAKTLKCGHPELRSHMCGTKKCSNSVYAK